MNRGILFRIVLVFAALLLGVGRLRSAAQSSKLQVAFIYQFTRLIEWCPSGKQGDFIIGVLGSNASIGKDLASLEGRKVGHQTIRIVAYANAREVGECQILYIPKSSEQTLGRALASTSSTCTLVIGEVGGQIHDGAGISFREQDGKLNYEVNTQFMKQRGLKVSDQLVRLAKATI